MASKRTYTYKDLGIIVGVDESTIRRHAKALGIYPVNGNGRPALIAKRDAQLIIDDDYGPGAGIKKHRLTDYKDETAVNDPSTKEDHNVQMTIEDLEAYPRPNYQRIVNAIVSEESEWLKQVTILEKLRDKYPTDDLLLKCAVNVMIGGQKT